MADVSTLDRALYAVPLAARYLRVPPTTLQYWLEGGIRDGKSYDPVVRAHPTGSRDLTWGEFVECWYVRQYRRTHEVPMAEVRRLINRLRSELGLKYPLAHRKAYVAAGKKLAQRVQIESEISPKAWMVVAEPDGQLGLSTIAAQFLAEVDFGKADDGAAVSIHPDGDRSPVCIQPDVAFGAPQIRGIRTENLAELADAGEDMETIAADFGLERADLQAALSYEWRKPPDAAVA